MPYGYSLPFYLPDVYLRHSTHARIYRLLPYATIYHGLAVVYSRQLLLVLGYSPVLALLHWIYAPLVITLIVTGYLWLYIAMPAFQHLFFPPYVCPFVELLGYYLPTLLDTTPRPLYTFTPRPPTHWLFYVTPLDVVNLLFYTVYVVHPPRAATPFLYHTITALFTFS